MTFTVEAGKTYETRNGNRVTVSHRIGAPSMSSYKFMAEGEHRSYSITRNGREYVEERSGSDLVREIKEEGVNVDASELAKAKSAMDQAKSEYLKGLVSLQQSLPEGIKLMVDGEEFNGELAGFPQVPSETLHTIHNKSQVKAGDTLRYMPSEGGSTNGRGVGFIDGRDYVVTYVDSYNDPRMKIDEQRRTVDTRGFLGEFKIVRSGVDQGQWVTLTRENRDRLSVGDKVRPTQTMTYLARGTEYEIVAKPDRDGRFRDERNAVRDTCGFYDGELEVFFRN